MGIMDPRAYVLLSTIIFKLPLLLGPPELFWGALPPAPAGKLAAPQIPLQLGRRPPWKPSVAPGGRAGLGGRPGQPCPVWPAPAGPAWLVVRSMIQLWNSLPFYL